MTDWTIEAIIRFHHEHPLEGYRQLTFMMLDANVVAVRLTVDSSAYQKEPVP